MLLSSYLSSSMMSSSFGAAPLSSADGLAAALVARSRVGGGGISVDGAVVAVASLTDWSDNSLRCRILSLFMSTDGSWVLCCRSTLAALLDEGEEHASLGAVGEEQLTL